MVRRKNGSAESARLKKLGAKSANCAQAADGLDYSDGTLVI
jgi:hypothetical protein